MSAVTVAQSVSKTESNQFARWRRPAFFLLIALLAIPALHPFFTAGFPTTSDGELHLMRLAALDAEIGRGNLFPRWMADLFHGYGYPLFNFYGPAVYYVAAGLQLFGLNYATAYVTVISLLVILGGWGVFLLAEDFWRTDEQRGQWAALLTAIAYMYAPYLLTNAYIRGAIAEVGAQALLPWIFWSFRRLLMDEHPARFALIAAISLAALAVTHTITLLFLPLGLLIYIAVLGWQQHRANRLTRQSLTWVLICGAAAMGMSACFWLPLIGERGELARLAYAVQHLPEHVWTWRNFVQWQAPHVYTPTIPFRLGAVQLGLALLGILSVRRRRVEWWFWLGLTVVGMIGVSRSALVLWQSIELLQIAQFPWRLLSFISLGLALLSGGLVARWRMPAVRILVSIGAIIIVIITQRPDVTDLDMTALTDITVNPANVAHYEADWNAFGASWTKEFLPRWAEDFGTSLAPANKPAARLIVELSRVASKSVEFNVTAEETTPLTFDQFYFPGWQARLDGNAAALYPSKPQGLLTVDIPPGEHTLRIVWRDTGLRRAGAWISLASLLLFGATLWWYGRRRIAALIPWAMAGMAAFMILAPTERVANLQRPDQSLAVGGLELLGYTVAQSDNESLLIHPYWHVRGESPAGSWRWQLADSTGAIVAEVAGDPWYGTADAAVWPVNAIMRDGVRMALPPSTTAGRYRLQLEYAGTAVTAGEIELTSATPAVVESRGIEFADAESADRVALDRVELAVNGRAAVLDLDARSVPTTVNPGDHLRYTLHWRAAGPVSEDYHTFIHLVDTQGNVLTGHDQMPGTDLNPPRLWNEHYPHPDTFTLHVPKDATSGIYHPQVGLYSFEDGRRFEALSAGDTPLGDIFTLPALKVVNSMRARPDETVDAEFDRVGPLLGYNLEASARELTPGARFTVTLVYRADGPTDVDYTQFVHLANDEFGLAAQVDEQPQSGGNPTSSWVRNEVIVAPVTLTVADDAQPGQYQLRVGLYDAQADGARVAVHGKDGQSLPGNQVVLTELTITTNALP